MLYLKAVRRFNQPLRRPIDAFLLRVGVQRWGRDAACSRAVLRAASVSQGITLGAMSLLIAAQALAIDATLVSSD